MQDRGPITDAALERPAGPRVRQSREAGWSQERAKPLCGTQQIHSLAGAPFTQLYGKQMY